MNATRNEAGAYVPRPGERVTVRRYMQPTLTPGDPERCLMIQFTGVIARLSDLEHKIYFEPGSMVTEYLRLPHDGPEWLSPVGTDYVYLGQSAGGYYVTEVVPAEQAAGTFARQVTPDLVVGTDSSQCIVLLVGGIGPKDPIRKVTVTDVDALKAALDDARTAQRIAMKESDAARLRGPDEARRARGRLTRNEAVDWLVRRYEVSRNRAAQVVNLLEAGRSLPGMCEMTYDGTYWVVPAEKA